MRYVNHITKVSLKELEVREKEAHFKMESLLSQVQNIDLELKEIEDRIRQCKEFLENKNDANG